jgi:hypothetical protein
MIEIYTTKSKPFSTPKNCPTLSIVSGGSHINTRAPAQKNSQKNILIIEVLSLRTLSTN